MWLIHSFGLHLRAYVLGTALATEDVSVYKTEENPWPRKLLFRGEVDLRPRKWANVMEEIEDALEEKN